MDVLFTEAERLGLNGRVAVEAAQDPRRLSALSVLLGYSDAGRTGTQGAVSRRYRFYLFHLETIAAYHSVTNDVYSAEGLRPKVGTPLLKGRMTHTYHSREWDRTEPGVVTDRRQKQAEKAAGRILYMLGLDYGMVDIGINISGKPELLAVQPHPELDEQAAASFELAIARYRLEKMEESKRISVATLGADPEFLLINEGGKVVPASAFLPKRGPAGCDHVRIGDKLLYPLAELRPEPSADPRRVVASIRRALLEAADWIPHSPGMRWLAGGMPAKGFALGGHIHLSGLWLNSSLLRVLDNYMALPLVLIEDDRSRARRPRYGAPGDFRRQSHGGFEYRTLPSWLVSPRMTRGVLALASLLSTSYRQLHQRPLQRFNILQAYYEGNKPKLAAVVKPLIEEIYGLPDYVRYEEMLSPLLRMIGRGECWDESADIRIGWKIGPMAELS